MQKFFALMLGLAISGLAASPAAAATAGWTWSTHDTQGFPAPGSPGASDPTRWGATDAGPLQWRLENYTIYNLIPLPIVHGTDEFAKGDREILGIGGGAFWVSPFITQDLRDVVKTDPEALKAFDTADVQYAIGYYGGLAAGIAGVGPGGYMMLTNIKSTGIPAILTGLELMVAGYVADTVITGVFYRFGDNAVQGGVDHFNAGARTSARPTGFALGMSVMPSSTADLQVSLAHATF